MTVSTAEVCFNVLHITGSHPRRVKRFRNGVAHYVFEIENTDGSLFVLRIGQPTQKLAMERGLELQLHLRSLGVPLPRILSTGVFEGRPWVAMERLPGNDLGDVLGSVPSSSLETIAQGLVEAQALVRSVGSGNKFGYAVTGEEAPYENWSSVLLDSIDRSKRRIHETRSFEPDMSEAVESWIYDFQPELDEQPPIAFLHDTTTRNVIVSQQGQLSGIVDVDDLCFGDPRYVVALTTAVLLSGGHTDFYIRRWMSLAGFCADRLFWLYVALFLVDLMSEHGQTFNGNVSPSTSVARARLRQRFSSVCRLVAGDSMLSTTGEMWPT